MTLPYSIKRHIVVIAFLLLTATAPHSQEDTANTAPAATPCQIPEMRQFDFWVGQWDLTWEGGSGSNTITRQLDDCVIQEQFDSDAQSNFRGMSVSTFSKLDGKWHQTWVDNQGGYLDFVGGMKDDRMILSRQAERDGKTFLQRMVWYDIAGDSLEWNWERSDDNGETWQTLWHISYKRKK